MNSIFIAYGALGLAIVCEVVGTTFLQKSEQFTRLVPSLVMVAAYIGSFYFLSQALRSLPLGVALTAAIGVVVFRQTLDAAALVGIGMIVGGVVVVQTLSTSVSH
jgi:small multidrug resistance pump